MLILGRYQISKNILRQLIEPSMSFTNCLAMFQLSLVGYCVLLAMLSSSVMGATLPIKSTEVCSEYIDKCQTCHNPPMKCTQCEPHSTFSVSGAMCLKCPAGCATCEDTAAGLQCLQCAEGFSHNGNGICLRCSDIEGYIFIIFLF